MKKPINTVYVVTMYRFGNRERHSYVIGAFSTKTKAEKEAEAERMNRGGNKYMPEILEVPIDQPYEMTNYFKRLNELKEIM